jgi:hypothetical protein
MEVEGKRAKGCPRRRWMECVEEEMAGKKLKMQDHVGGRKKTATLHNVGKAWERRRS